VLVIVGGHFQGLRLLTDQPMKAAASEWIWDTENPASFSIIAMYDKKGEYETWALRVPRALSFLYYFRMEGEVKGIQQIQEEYQEKYGPGNYIPPIWVIFYSFRIMVAAGFAMLALAAYALYFVVRRKVAPNIRWLGLFVWAIALPYIANSFGWIMTEVGRQPFTVYGLLKTENSVSPNLSTGDVLISLTGFTLVYIILLIVDIYLLTKNVKAGPVAAETQE
jgi:cytochrome d ubiquinol oxidase subunit I